MKDESREPPRNSWGKDLHQMGTAVGRSMDKRVAEYEHARCAVWRRISNKNPHFKIREGGSNARKQN